MNIAHAAVNYTVQNLTADVSGSADPGKFVLQIYQFALLIGGILAFAAIVYGGIKYTLEAGNPSGKSDGKEWITQALLGLLLLLGAYIILNTINPNLTNLSLPSLTPIAAAPSGGTAQNTSGNGGNNGGGGGGGGSPYNGGGFGGGGASSDFSTLTDAEARTQLQAANISVVGNTSLQGIKAQTIDETINLGKQCGCDVTVTGGTEQGHATGEFSHANGYKIDLRVTNQLDSYIQKNFPHIGQRSDKALLYQSPSGAIYARESNHWDIVVK